MTTAQQTIEINVNDIITFTRRTGKTMTGKVEHAADECGEMLVRVKSKLYVVNARIETIISVSKA